jgi:hypothetical protein
VIADEREPDELETRCSLEIAGRYLGKTPRHVLKLIHSGVIDAWDMRTPGASRASWSVRVSSIRSLLAERHRKAEKEARIAPDSRDAHQSRGRS